MRRAMLNTFGEEMCPLVVGTSSQFELVPFESHSIMHEDGHEESFAGIGSLQTMGILNALRTGDPRVDMILAMLPPFAVRFIVDMASKLQNCIMFSLFRSKGHPRVHERTISEEMTQNAYGSLSSLDPDSQNSILLKAIQHYLHSVVKLDLRQADLTLTSTENTSSIGYYYSYYDYDDDDKSSSKSLAGTLANYSIVKKPPPGQWHRLGEHGKSKKQMVSLLIDRVEEDEGKKTRRVINVYRFQSESGEAIDDFVSKAYYWYVGELRKLDDNSRYFYEVKQTPSDLSVNDDNDGSTCRAPSGACLYTRYRLSEEKTFNSLFFRQKDSLLKLVQNFQQRTGKYSIEGYPHKLGLLLHGPPGTGKTSLIRALAQYTGRSVINVPLARLSTNAELMSIFFDRRRKVQDEYMPVKHAFKDVIFVMEDVDAVSRIVRRRDGKTTPTTIEHGRMDLPLPKSLWHMLLESNESDCRGLVELLMSKSEELKDEATRPEVVAGFARKAASLPGLTIVGESTDHPLLESIEKEALNNVKKILNNQSTIGQYLSNHARVLRNMIEDGGTEVDQSLVDELLGRPSSRQLAAYPLSLSPSFESMDDQSMVKVDKADEVASMLPSPGKSSDKKEGKFVIGPSLWDKPGKDQLNLTGILNVLDGVVDSPGRIVIMTTNHVEHLDPALIRPGRIDKKLLLGYMEVADVIAMLEHYYQLALDDGQKRRIDTVMSGGSGVSKFNITPAQVEQLVAENDDVEDMISALEAKSELPCFA